MKAKTQSSLFSFFKSSTKSDKADADVEDAPGTYDRQNEKGKENDNPVGDHGTVDEHRSLDIDDKIGTVAKEVTVDREGEREGADDINDEEEDDEEMDISAQAAPSSDNRNSSTSNNSYEQLRQENIRRNAEFLASLGLDSLKPQISNKPSLIKPKSAGEKKRKQPSSISSASIGPLRRSSRTANLPPVNYDSSLANNKLQEEEEEEEEEEEVEIDYDDSTVFKYMISSSSSSSLSSSTNGTKVYKSLAYNLHSSDPGYIEDLEATYSMQFHPSMDGLLLVGGKSGYVSLMQTPRNGHEESNLLMSSRCHNRWVSTNKFLSCQSQQQQQLHMITASDDGCIKIWDLTKCSVNTIHSSPKLIASNDSIHSKRGVYSFDESSGYIVSGSKDRCVCISRIDVDSDMKIKQELCHDEYHNGVVKSVSWKYEINNAKPNIYVSGGQDRVVCVKDVRQPQTEGYISLFENNSGIHHVEFDNTATLSNEYCSSNLFVVAGLDPVVRVYDLRMLSDSRKDKSLHLYEFIGHASSSVKKFKAMLAPHFMSSDVLVSLGEGSENVSFYCLKTGKTLTRGEMPETPMAVAVNPCSMGWADLNEEESNDQTDEGINSSSVSKLKISSHLAVATRKSRQFLSVMLT